MVANWRCALFIRKTKTATKICSKRALAWQLSFQCRDGGWAAFDKDVIDGWPRKYAFFADHNAILDPTCSDLTARTLELFGYINFDRQDAGVEKAIQYFDSPPRKTIGSCVRTFGA